MHVGLSKYALLTGVRRAYSAHMCCYKYLNVTLSTFSCFLACPAFRHSRCWMICLSNRCLMRWYECKCYCVHSCFMECPDHRCIETCLCFRCLIICHACRCPVVYHRCNACTLCQKLIYFSCNCFKDWTNAVYLKHDYLLIGKQQC